MAPRIVLLHATPVAMAPVQAAFAEHWPEAETENLLDDGLSLDRARVPGDISQAMSAEEPSTARKPTLRAGMKRPSTPSTA